MIRTKLLLPFILFFFLILIIVSITILSILQPILSTKRDTEFHVVKYDPLSHTRKSGSISLPAKLGSNEFLSYQQRDESLILIAPFSHQTKSEEFTCSGTCLCLDHSERRSSTVISRGLVYLVSAISTTYAVHLAHQHFKSQCHQISNCQKLESEVDCYMLSESSEEPSDVKTTSTETVNLEKRSVGKWMCSGDCVPLDKERILTSSPTPIEEEYLAFFRSQYDYIESTSNQLICGNRVEEDYPIVGDESSQYFIDGDVPMQMMEVKKKFIDQHFDEFCRVNSVQQVHLPNRWGAGIGERFQFCGALDVQGNNPSIQCEPFSDD